jgi:hypothetical protein
MLCGQVKMNRRFGETYCSTCKLLHASSLRVLLSDAVLEGDMFFRNVGSILPNNTALYPTRHRTPDHLNYLHDFLNTRRGMPSEPFKHKSTDKSYVESDRIDSHDIRMNFPYRISILYMHTMNIYPSSFWRVVTMVNNTRNFWVSGLYPSSGVWPTTTFRKLDLFPSSGKRGGRGKKTPTQFGPLERANLNHWTTDWD